MIVTHELKKESFLNQVRFEERYIRDKYYELWLTEIHCFNTNEMLMKIFYIETTVPCETYADIKERSYVRVDVIFCMRKSVKIASAF